MAFAQRHILNHAGLRYTIEKVIGEGAFGTVYLINNVETGQRAALKKIEEDPRYKSRELEVLQAINHPNCLTLMHHFVNEHHNSKAQYLNLVTEYVPETLSTVERQYISAGQTLPILLVKLISYQLLRVLAYLNGKKICHRDIKPANILMHPSSCILKLCDFGSAKFVRANEQSISYITSRPYRAPELLLGATRYDGAIDQWSAGCVIAEMLLGQPLFIGDNNAEQLLAIIHILGSPSRAQLIAMNPQCAQFQLPVLQALPWRSAFRASADAQGVDLVSKLCVFDPSERISGYEALLHPFFDDLRAPEASLPGGRPMPPLFEFSREEMGFIGLDLLRQLVPHQMQMNKWFIEGMDPLAGNMEEEE